MRSYRTDGDPVPLYLGLDCSTQSLTATIIELDARSRRVVLEEALAFDRSFPAYGTDHGVWRHVGHVVTSSPRMWAEALDVIMGRIARALGDDLRRMDAVAGSGQQHGSVWLNPHADPALASLDPGSPLEPQIHGIVSRAESPVWMDDSAAAQGGAIEAAVGGPGALASLTGSRAYARFTGPQIRKIFEQEPDTWDATSRIHLVSSYMASLLAGRSVAIEPGDGSGMNLMNIRTSAWAPEALGATAPGLLRKLPSVQPSWTIAGPLAPYWQQRYAFPAASVVLWSGDNPCSLVGAGLIDESRTGISLGTSDTVFGFTREPQIDADGGSHVFGSPTGGFMSMVVFRNGSLARERVRDACGLDWAGFSAALRDSPPGNGGAIMVPWFEPEITPTVHRAGIHTVGMGSAPPRQRVRAVVEGQMMAMALHAPWAAARTRIHATGGASANRELLQVMADVFGADVYPMPGGNSAALGAALRAAHAATRARGVDTPWRDVVAGFTDPPGEARVAPKAQAVTVYREMKTRYAAAEAEALRDGR